MGFAFKDYASSIIAGIVGLFESPYGVGDRIKIGDYYGEVINYGLRSVTIQTPDDSTVTIPHNKIWTEAISNANSCLPGTGCYRILFSSRGRYQLS